MLIRIKKIQKSFSIILIIISSVIFVLSYVKNINDTKKEFQNQYDVALEKISSGYDYQGAVELLNELGDYRESLLYVEIANNWIQFKNGEMLRAEERYEDALNIFKELANNRNFEGAEQAAKQVAELEAILEDIRNRKELYSKAMQCLESENYIAALSLFNELGDYENSVELAKMCNTYVRILQNSTTISAGVVFSVGVTEEGKVVSSGDIILSQEDVNDWEDIVSVSAFGSLVIGLKMDETVVTAGELDNDYRIETSNWDDIIAVSAGDLYVVGLRENGTLVAQGYNGDGQMDIDDWTNIIAISTGWRHTVGLTNEGEVRIAGIRSKDEDEIRNSEEWNDIIAISAGGGYPGVAGEQGHTVGLRSDGKVVAIGDNGKGQCEVSKWDNIIAISAGAFHTVGLTSEGKVVTTQTDSRVLEEINAWENIVAVAAGYGTTFALGADGTVYSVGYDRQNQRDTDDWGTIAIHEEWRYILSNNLE